MYYSTRTRRYRQNGLSYVPKKILTGMLREARGVLKATVGNRVQPDYQFINIGFLFFSVSFSQSLVFPVRLCSKASQPILDNAALTKPGRDLKKILKSLLFFHKNKPKENKL